eukprot:6944907-Prymnesium_polylepis.1
MCLRLAVSTELSSPSACACMCVTGSRGLPGSAAACARTERANVSDGIEIPPPRPCVANASDVSLYSSLSGEREPC